MCTFVKLVDRPSARLSTLPKFTIREGAELPAFTYRGQRNPRFPAHILLANAQISDIRVLGQELTPSPTGMSLPCAVRRTGPKCFRKGARVVLTLPRAPAGGASGLVSELRQPVASVS
jgi:hypothetical protein